MLRMYIYIHIFFVQMSRKYERKTGRGVSLDVLKRAKEQVMAGSSVRTTANDFNIARMTLTRYIKNVTKKLMNKMCSDMKIVV